jgi:hypothetical protein
MSTKKFHPGKFRVARTAENSAVLIVSNIKVRIENQLFYHVHMCSLSVHEKGNPITKLGKLSKEKNSGSSEHFCWMTKIKLCLSIPGRCRGWGTVPHFLILNIRCRPWKSCTTRPLHFWRMCRFVQTEYQPVLALWCKEKSIKTPEM